MAGRRTVYIVSCLALVCILFCTFANVLVYRPSRAGNHSLSLAKDALLAACESVREAKLHLFGALEDRPGTVFQRNVHDHSTKLEQLQAYLDKLHQESHGALDAFSDPDSVEWRHVGDTNHIDTCESLAGKRITMIGGQHIYWLHLLLLRHRERAEKKAFPCLYHDFCSHHHICLPYQYSQDVAPPPRYIKPPTAQELIDTESTVVNYIISDTLLSAPNESFWAYTLPFVDPLTGIRLRETYWLAAARKANVVILGRGPLSAPESTYAGNWSFLRRVPDYVGGSLDPIARRYEDHDNKRTIPRSLEILNAAVHLTASRFLPDLLQLLQSIHQEDRPSKRKLLIWPSSWYRLPGRGAGRAAFHFHFRSNMIQQIFFDNRQAHSFAEHMLTLQLSASINADISNSALLEDPWTLSFNAQVYLQNMVLREVLPRHGIVFLPLDVPWVEDVESRGLDGVIHDKYTTAIGEAFLAGMDHIIRYLQ